ncbi:STM4504/CBY_0614 family protein [Rhizobium johnstonii]|uniref:STM4504/CBY_0614 family protein n=1 Tax=Rhizobium johnstonii TaxID=3019933 RepID=UPI003F997C2F
MTVYDIFSKRQKRLSATDEDVFQYRDIPAKLRVQIVHILNRSLGNEEQFYSSGGVQGAYKYIVETIREEAGVFYLLPSNYRATYKYYDELSIFLTEVAESEQCLDIVEVAFRVVNSIVRRDGYLGRRNGNSVADEAISDLNVRFRENAVGYQFVDNELIRIDSELIHVETVKPALRLLHTKEYAGPHEEFLSAYEHYREGKNKEALNDCLKAFESTMKAICDKRGWAYNAGDTAKALIDILFREGLVPSFWQTQFGALRSLLESSIPTGRNKQSGHGQGAKPTTVPDHMAAYMLHMTASTLVFLTTAEQSLP